MIEVIAAWYHRYFTDPEAVILLLLLVVATVVTLTMGGILGPVVASIVIAYVLEWAVSLATRWHIPRTFAVLLVFLLFLSGLILLIFGLVPMLWKQTAALINELPMHITRWQEALNLLPQKYPQLVSQGQISALTSSLRGTVASLGQLVFTRTLSSIPGLLALIIYLVIVPLMVFFFLYDREKLVNWLVSYLPKKRVLLQSIWYEVNTQLGNYVRGKVAEIFIVGGVSYIVFLLLGLHYTLLLSVTVGFSVLLPYIGAAVVTLPIALVALFQFGIGVDFTYVMVAYGVIQALDGNVLVPILFSEVVNLHPIAIIVAILVFGGFFGFWGIFFAIPLAILVQAIMNAWPRSSRR